MNDENICDEKLHDKQIVGGVKQGFKTITYIEVKQCE
jgi:hypothetical protein